MGLRVYRNLNAADIETGETKVISAMPLLIGENVRSYDFEIKMASVDNENPIGRYTPCNIAILMCSDVISLLYRDNDAGFTDDNLNDTDSVQTTGWSPTQLNNLFRNLINKQDSEGRLWYGGSLQNRPIAPMNLMAQQIGSGEDLNTDNDDNPSGVTNPTYSTEQYMVDAGFETFGPRIVVPLRQEFLLDRHAIVNTSGDARAEWSLRARVPIMGGFGDHGGIIMVGVWRETLSGQNGNPSERRFLIDSSHSATSFALSVGWSDQLRTQEIAQNSATEAGAWFRQLWSGDQYVENDAILTDDKLNVAIKGRYYVDTPYSIIGA